MSTIINIHIQNYPRRRWGYVGWALVYERIEFEKYVPYNPQNKNWLSHGIWETNEILKASLVKVVSNNIMSYNDINVYTGTDYV